MDSKYTVLAKGALIGLFVLNLVDATVSDYLIRNGFGVELNPLMSVLYTYNPFVFAGFKSLVTLVVVLGLWYETHLNPVRKIIAVATGLYGVLVIYYFVLLIVLGVYA